MTKTHNAHPLLAAVSRWLVPPLALLALLAGYRMILVVAAPAEESLAPARNEPRQVAPLDREDRVCSDEQLAAVLQRVKPPLDPMNTNHIVHALRLWGAEADFGDPAVPSGRMLRDYFLDDRMFQRLAGGATPPLFFHGPDGIDVRGYDDRAAFQTTSSYHTDDLLATLAEVGTPLDATMHLRDGEARVADLLRAAMRRYYADRMEYEWTILSYARYLHPHPPWRNKYGEKIDVEMMVEELLDKPPEAGPCDGLHRLEALVILYRLDEEPKALSRRARARMLAYMQAVSRRLVQAQSVEGYWTSGWSQDPSKAQDSKSKAGPTLHDKLLVTGHHLEWLALAPQEAQPPRETIVRAGQWLAQTLLEMDARQLETAYGPYSHAARALCLWKGVEPIKAWRGDPKVQGPKSKVAASR
jgi:hypothetical protein